MTGIITSCRWTWFKNWCIKTFIKKYNVDLTDVADPDFHHYPNFNAFFTRALKPGVRPIAPEPAAITSPVDGNIGQLGMVNSGELIQAKGSTFSLEQFLGDDVERAAPFQGGAYTTLYLGPKDYHRVHMPVSGQLIEMVHIPGQLFSVSPQIIETIPGVFARNERVVTLFTTEFGPMAVVLVGAMLVASIETVWAGVVTPSRYRQITTWDYTAREESITLEKGDELGRFKYGSTVVIVLPSEAAAWQENLTIGQAIQVGQSLGMFKNHEEG